MSNFRLKEILKKKSKLPLYENLILSSMGGFWTHISKGSESKNFDFFIEHSQQNGLPKAILSKGQKTKAGVEGVQC